MNLNREGVHLDLYIVPTLGRTKIREVSKGRIRAWLATLSEKHEPGGVRIIHATLRNMLTGAVDDGILLANLAERLGRFLRPSASPDQAEKVKAMDAKQLAGFLAKAEEIEPVHAPLFLLMATTGLRLGEAFGLQWRDIDFEEREILVQRSWSKGRLSTPKSGRVRRVDMSGSLKDRLRRLSLSRRQEALREGRGGNVPEWIFCTSVGTPLDQSKVSKAFRRVLKKSELPLYYSPHCLRHTYASLMLQQGESPVYVQRQLGHASIQLTVDTYGRWLAMGKKAAVEQLAGRIAAASAESGSKTVAKRGGSAERWRAQRDLNPRPTDSKSGALSG